MLAIRMQRTGRKRHAQFRVIVQDSKRSPTSGKLVAQLGHYNPHNKQIVLDKEKTSFYLSNGAQPSTRVIGLLKSEKIKLPDWVTLVPKKSGQIRNIEKLRRNRPAESETKQPVAAEAGADSGQTPAKPQKTSEPVVATEENVGSEKPEIENAVNTDERAKGNEPEHMEAAAETVTEEPIEKIEDTSSSEETA